MNIVVAAHPDDEVIGLGGQLPYLRDSVFVHITDGAPRNMMDAHAYGFSSREEYARQRRNEVLQALSLVGIHEEQCLDFRFVDQEATFNLRAITAGIYDLIRDLRPRYVLTHPYEGGHPDHDSVAFACHSARELLLRQGICPGILIEFTSYHCHDGRHIAGEFLPWPGQHVITSSLLPLQHALKKHLFSCFSTQQAVLAGFPIETERFRVAPKYDFRNPPHDGLLYYENFPWGMTGGKWRSIAAATLCELGLC